jgi:hypothetical protein
MSAPTAIAADLRAPRPTALSPYDYLDSTGSGGTLSFWRPGRQSRLRARFRYVKSRAFLIWNKRASVSGPYDED